MTETQTQNKELSLFLEAHPGLETLELLVPDMNGIIRGKRINVDEADTLYENGLNFPAATHLLDSSGNVIDDLILGTDDGDPDFTARPVENSLVMVPWLDNPTAQAIITLVDRDNEPYANESRNILKKTVGILNEARTLSHSRRGVGVLSDSRPGRFKYFPKIWTCSRYHASPGRTPSLFIGGFTGIGSVF